MTPYISARIAADETSLDVTEGVQVIFDALCGSMGAGSGWLDYREWCALRQVAYALGVDVDAVPSGPHHGTGLRWHHWPDPAAPLTNEPAPEQANKYRTETNWQISASNRNFRVVIKLDAKPDDVQEAELKVLVAKTFHKLHDQHPDSVHLQRIDKDFPL